MLEPVLFPDLVFFFATNKLTCDSLSVAESS
jgi:hypothetical protein